MILAEHVTFFLQEYFYTLFLILYYQFNLAYLFEITLHPP